MPTTQPDRHLPGAEYAEASKRAAIHSTIIPREFDLGFAGFGGSAGEFDDAVVRKEGELVSGEVSGDGGGEEGL